MRAKFAVVSLVDFADGAAGRGLRPGIWARFCQPALAVHVRDDAARAALVSALVEAHRQRDFSKSGLKTYRTLLEESYVLKDLKMYRRTPHMLHNDRIYSQRNNFV